MTTPKIVFSMMRKQTLLVCILIFCTTLLAYAGPAYGIRFAGVKFLFNISGGFNAPSDVAVSKSGRIYVVDGVNNTIKVFNPQGQMVSAFGKAGSGPGEFRSPLGIELDAAGKVYIADSGNHRVQIFNPGGEFVAEIKVASKTPKPADPTDVAVDASRKRCYVVDNDNHRLLAYDLATFELTGTYGSLGTGKLAFRYPFLITLDKDKYLYVVDVINTRVQVLNPDGLFVAFIGDWGVEKGHFFRPKGIAIDKDGKVFVSDSYMGVVQIFEADGDFFAVVSDPGVGRAKKFETPNGLFIDHQNRLYVVEMVANRVGVYQLESGAE